MIVFKNYFKIVRNNLGMILTFLGISMAIGIANTSYIHSEETQYVNAKPTIAIINQDCDSKISNHYEKFIKNNFKIEKIKNSKKDIQDALYGKKVDVIVFIDKNFGEKFLNGENPKIRIKEGIEYSSQYVSILTNRYLKIADLYRNSGMNENLIIKNLDKDLKKEVKINIAKTESKGINKLAVFYTFQNYSSLGIIIFVIGTIMSIFNNETIKKRNQVSSLKTCSYTTQLLFGHLVLGISLFTVIAIVALCVYGKLAISKYNVLLLINLFFFIISVSSMGYLIGIFVKNSNVMAGIQNVVALGLSFISGCFVPIELLDKNIVNISKLFPSYWFVKNNYDICKLSKISLETIKPILNIYFIILMFGLIYFVVSLIIMKKKRS